MRIDNELPRNHPLRAKVETAVMSALALAGAEWDAWIHFSAAKGWMVQVTTAGGWRCVITGKGIMEPDHVHEQLSAALRDTAALPC